MVFQDKWILRALIQQEKRGLKLKVVLKYQDVYLVNTKCMRKLSMMTLYHKIKGILKHVKIEGSSIKGRQCTSIHHHVHVLQL